ncbi:MAG: phosphoglycerate kinase [Haloferacaceae archaeon]
MLTLDDLPPDHRLLVRLDLNTAVEDGEVRTNRRFARHAETLARLRADGHAVGVLAHQGRPGGDDFTTLAAHADLLAETLDGPVSFVPDTHGDEALEAVRDLDAGEILLLENVRMTDDELADRTPAEHGESALVRALAPEFDAYVNDAYSAAHRAQASLVGFPEVMPAYAGSVMVTEYEANRAVAEREFDGPVTMVFGGSKATDIVRAMEALADEVDTVVLGGIAGELALRAEGHPVGHDLPGTDLFDDQWAEAGDELERVLDAHGDAIRLPVDLAFLDDDRRAEVGVEEIAEKTVAYRDIGTETLMNYAPVVRDSAAVLVKGALGVFEDERFSVGTVGLLEAVADTDCFSVVGGGDTSRAVDLYDLDPADFDHLSIAGGAYLRALTGEPLPAVEALERAEAAGRRLAD